MTSKIHTHTTLPYTQYLLEVIFHRSLNVFMKVKFAIRRKMCLHFILRGKRLTNWTKKLNRSGKPKEKREATYIDKPIANSQIIHL